MCNYNLRHLYEGAGGLYLKLNEILRGVKERIEKRK